MSSPSSSTHTRPSRPSGRPGSRRITARRLVALVVGTVLVGVAPTSFALASLTWTEQAKVAPSDGQAGDQFGDAVALDDNTLVVGTFLHDGGRGAVYVYVRDGETWSEQAKIVNPGGQLDRFGSRVAIDLDTIVVGASGRSTTSGVVYVFTRSGTTWSLQQTLSGNATNGDDFGYSLSIEGDTLAVGARGTTSDVGSAFLFSRSGTVWTETAELSAGSAGDRFGTSIAVSGNTLSVGATRASGDTGAAYIFTRSGGSWSQQATIAPADLAVGDRFGLSLSLEDGTLAVGAPVQDSLRGAAYVFAGAGALWTQQAKLVDSGGIDQRFGESVAVGDDIVAVGKSSVAGQSGGRVDPPGSVVVFARSGSSWSENSRLTAPNPADYDYFGHSVDLDARTLVTSKIGDSSLMGSVYIFTTPAVPDAHPAATTQTPKTSCPVSLSPTECARFIRSGLSLAEFTSQQLAATGISKPVLGLGALGATGLLIFGIGAIVVSQVSLRSR